MLTQSTMKNSLTSYKKLPQSKEKKWLKEVGDKYKTPSKTAQKLALIESIEKLRKHDLRKEVNLRLGQHLEREFKASQAERTSVNGSMGGTFDNLDE